MKVEFIEIGKEYSRGGSKMLQKHEEKQHSKRNQKKIHQLKEQSSPFAYQDKENPQKPVN